MAQSSAVRVVVVFAILSSALRVTASVSGRALPIHLEYHLLKRGSPVVARYDWQAMRGLPPVRRLLENDLEDLPRGLMVVGPAVTTVQVLDLDEAVIEEIWVAMKDLDGSSRDTAWVATSLGSDELQNRFEAAGWAPYPGQQRVYARVEDAEMTPDDRAALETMPEAEREAALARFLKSVHRVAIMEDGWLYVVPPFTSIPWEVRHPRKPSVTGTTEKPTPAFPFDGLLELEAPLICVMAVDTPGNEGAEEDDENDTVSLDSMRRRLSALRGRPEDVVAGELGDFLLTFSEVDGGIAVDVVARRIDGGGEEATERFLELMVLILRLGVSYASPGLAHELGDARVATTHGEVRAEVVISLASLEEALDVETQRRREIHELRRLVNEFERDAERRRATGGS